MRKLSIALILSLSLALSGCGGEAEPSVVDLSEPAPTPIPTAAPGPEAEDLGFATSRVELFFPEEAEEATAQYKLGYSAPVFNDPALDEAVNRYLDELYTRVTEERMPLADRAEGEPLPSTTVEFAVQYAELPQGRYTNIIFTETATYAADSPGESSIYTIVADPEGRECGLAAASGVYEPEALAAQQVWNIIDREAEGYYGDLTIESIAPALDLYNGFTVAEEGYTVFVPAGALAGEDRGILEFSFALSALYPGFVGDVVSAPEYEAILPQLNAAAAACGPDFSGFAGAPEGGMGLAFTREYILNGRSLAQVGAEEFSLAYQGVFGRPIAPENAPGVELSGDSVSLAAQSPIYRFQCQDAYMSGGEGGDALTITGEVMAGAPGSGDAGATAAATATFETGEGGWAITSFEIM